MSLYGCTFHFTPVDLGMYALMGMPTGMHYALTGLHYTQILRNISASIGKAA